MAGGKTVDDVKLVALLAVLKSSPAPAENKLMFVLTTIGITVQSWARDIQVINEELKQIEGYISSGSTNSIHELNQKAKSAMQDLSDRLTQALALVNEHLPENQEQP
jgi:hypothetical protein